MMLDKDSEEFDNVTVPLSGLHELQAQSQEHMCSVTGIPLVKFTGISPTGLNASDEGQIRVFYDAIAAYQEKFFRENLTKVFHFLQLNLWGKVDPDLSFVFEPLWSLDEAALAGMRKTEADTDGSYIDRGVLSPKEVRERLAGDPDSPYASIDVEDVPEPPAEEGAPDPFAEEGAAAGPEAPNPGASTPEIVTQAIRQAA